MRIHIKREHKLLNPVLHLKSKTLCLVDDDNGQSGCRSTVRVVAVTESQRNPGILLIPTSEQSALDGLREGFSAAPHAPASNVFGFLISFIGLPYRVALLVSISLIRGFLPF